MKMSNVLWRKLVALFAGDPFNLLNEIADSLNLDVITADFDPATVTLKSELTLGLSGVAISGNNLVYGYNSVNDDWKSDDIVVTSVIDQPLWQITSSGSVFPRTAYGYALFDGNTDRLLATEKFPEPVVFLRSGQAINLPNPTFRFPLSILK